MATLFEERPVQLEAADVAPELIDRVALKALPRLLAVWGLDNPSSAFLMGVTERTWSRIKNGSWAGELNQDQRMRASALTGLYLGLHVYFSDPLADEWVRLDNKGPLFKGRSPLAFMLAGGLPAIIATRDYIDAVRGGV